MNTTYALTMQVNDCIEQINISPSKVLHTHHTLKMIKILVACGSDIEGVTNLKEFHELKREWNS